MQCLHVQKGLETRPVTVLNIKLGAMLVGLPSNQAGNCFGDVLMFKLNNAGISGQVSYNQRLAFPNDPEIRKRLSREMIYRERRVSDSVVLFGTVQ